MRWIGAVLLGLVVWGIEADARAGEVISPSGFAVSFPDDWRVASAEELAVAKGKGKDAADHLVLLLLGPTRSGFCDNLSVTIMPTVLPINEATEKALAGQIAAALGKKVEEIHCKRLEIQGRTALSLALEKPVGEQGMPARFWMVYLPGKERTYLFIGTVMQSRWEELWPVVKKIVYTARIDLPRSDGGPPRGAAGQEAEAWAKLPPEQWPQLVLTNAAKFKGHTALEGASSFLIRSEAGEVLAATARHLLGENGGVEPEVTLADLDACLDSWWMYPRTKPDRRVRILGSASLTSGPQSNDWVLLRVEGKPSHATPLRIRPTPVQLGEKVFLVGVSYAEPTVSQKVYRGTVTERKYGDRFRYDITPQVDIRGFSGAPIVDEAGLLVGVMTVWFDPHKNGELWTEAGGEDAAGALAILKTDK